jgi:hypothetical protein
VTESKLFSLPYIQVLKARGNLTESRVPLLAYTGEGIPDWVDQVNPGDYNAL